MRQKKNETSFLIATHTKGGQVVGGEMVEEGNEQSVGEWPTTTLSQHLMFGN